MITCFFNALKGLSFIGRIRYDSYNFEMIICPANKIQSTPYAVTMHCMYWKNFMLNEIILKSILQISVYFVFSAAEEPKRSQRYLLATIKKYYTALEFRLSDFPG